MPEEECNLIEKARHRSFRMGTMIDELLATTTSDETTYKETEVSCGESVREAIKRVQPVIQAKGIELVVLSGFRRSRETMSGSARCSTICCPMPGSSSTAGRDEWRLGTT